jgi:hypothetical protein
MKSNKIINNLLRNWPVKMFSFLIALALYLVISLSLMGSLEVEIPITIIHPAGFEALSIVEDKVELTIRTQQKYVALINPNAITAIADFSFVHTDGVASSRVSLEYDESLFNIDISIIADPEFIRVFYQKVNEDAASSEEVVL